MVSDQLNPDDDNLATAAVLAHGIINSLQYVRAALEFATEHATDMDPRIKEIVVSAPAHIDLAIDHLWLIVRTTNSPMGDILSDLNERTTESAE